MLWLIVGLCINLMLNLQQGSNDLEFVRDTVSHVFEVSPQSGTVEIR